MNWKTPGGAWSAPGGRFLNLLLLFAFAFRARDAFRRRGVPSARGAHGRRARVASVAARPGAHGVPRPHARVAAGQSARQRRAANHRRGARRAATGRQEGLRRRARPDGARPQTRHRCASGPSRARVSARLLVAVLCVCCNGTSVTVLSLCSVSRAIGAERSLFARDGRQIDVQGQPRDRGIYIFANADSQKQIQIADFRFQTATR